MILIVVYLTGYLLFICYPSLYLFKFDNGNTRARCEICSKVPLKTAVVFIVNFEQISHIFWCSYCRLWTGKWLFGCFIFTIVRHSASVGQRHMISLSSVYPSLRPSVTKFSQDCILVFSDIVHDFLEFGT